MKKDRTGQRYGMLVVKGFVRGDGKKTYWICKCDCGNTKIINSKYLATSPFPNCGCSVHKGSIPKPHRKRLYGIYTKMIHRCFDKSNPGYKNYGGRGIQPCIEWIDNYDNFYDWAIKAGYTPGLTIERIDNNGPYSPENCRWATKREQTRNTRRNKFITYQGKTLCINDWAAALGIHRKTIASRLKRGLPPQQILGLDNGKQN